MYIYINIEQRYLDISISTTEMFVIQNCHQQLAKEVRSKTVTNANLPFRCLDIIHNFLRVVLKSMFNPTTCLLRKTEISLENG